MSGKPKRIWGAMTALGIWLLVSWIVPTGVWAGASTTDQGGGDSFASLGITGANCNHCSYTYNVKSGDRFWTFESEPVITAVDPDGPAAGKLRRGDKIAAIDEMPITTYGAGKRLANITPGQTVKLHLRRGGSLFEEVVVARTPEPGEEPEIEGLRGPLSKTDLQLLAGVVTQFGFDPEAAELVKELAELAGLSADELAELGSAGPRSGPQGWLGVRLSFSGSVVDWPSGSGRWSFNTSPKVSSVVRDGPADRAGLRSGDILTHIDGIRLDSRKGGRRFSEVRPGEHVTWTVQREGRTLTVEMVAGKSTESEH